MTSFFLVYIKNYFKVTLNEIYERAGHVVGLSPVLQVDRLCPDPLGKISCFFQLLFIELVTDKMSL